MKKLPSVIELYITPEELELKDYQDNQSCPVTRALMREYEIDRHRILIGALTGYIDESEYSISREDAAKLFRLTGISDLEKGITITLTKTRYEKAVYNND